MRYLLQPIGARNETPLGVTVMAYIDRMIRQSGELQSVPDKDQPAQTLRLGTVQKITDENISLDTLSNTVQVHRAAGCLLAPNVGDLCLFSFSDSDLKQEAWIISVLSRANSSLAEILLPDNTAVKTPDGSLTFEAKNITLKSDQLNMSSETASITFSDVKIASRTARLTVGTLKTVASYLSLVADRILQHSQSYSRTTAGLDRTEAPQIELNAKQLLKLKGDYTLIEGDRLVKARGAQIHFG
jgi:Protein of unknown function (DUF3540)